MERVALVVGNMDLVMAYRVTKAFAIYSNDKPRRDQSSQRRRRTSQLSPQVPPRQDRFRGTLRRMREAGIDCKAALDWLRLIEVVPVSRPSHGSRSSYCAFQATARRRKSGDSRSIALTDAAEQNSRPPLRRRSPPSGRQTKYDDVRRRYADEIKMGLDYYSGCLISTLPQLYNEFADAFRQIYECKLSADELPTFLRFGSWIGGDRDGNPYVTANCTRDALQLARQ